MNNSLGTSKVNKDEVKKCQCIIDAIYKDFCTNNPDPRKIVYRKSFKKNK